MHSPLSRRSINIQQSPEVQTGEQHKSIMDFLLPFIRFLQGNAVEAYTGTE